MDKFQCFSDDKSGKILSLITNTPETEVRQIPASVGKLGRLGPKLLTALIRKRRVDQPVRFNTTDVALGFVTLWMNLKIFGSWFDSCSTKKCRMGASFEALGVHVRVVVRFWHVSSVMSRLVGGNGTPTNKTKGTHVKKINIIIHQKLHVHINRISTHSFSSPYLLKSHDQQPLNFSTSQCCPYLSALTLFGCSIYCI